MSCTFDSNLPAMATALDVTISTNVITHYKAVPMSFELSYIIGPHYHAQTPHKDIFNHISDLHPQNPP